MLNNELFKKNTLFKIEDELNDYYEFKEGNDLNSIVSKVLNNMDLNLYLLSFLPKNKGIKLGKISHIENPNKDIYYGLTINFNNTPRSAKLFLAEGFNSRLNLKEITGEFPVYAHEYPFKKWPSSDQFLEEVNYIFSKENFQDDMIDLKK